MTQYYVVEIQKYDDGGYGHIVHFAADEDPTVARYKGEAKYHEVLAAAAVSRLPEHGAILFHSSCVPVLHQNYKHEIAESPAE